MSFGDLPVNLQHRITWLYRQNLWRERQVPRVTLLRLLAGGHRDTWYSKTVSFTLTDTKSMIINRRGDSHYLCVDTSHVCTEVQVLVEDGVALVCTCVQGDQSVSVSLQCCHTRKANRIEETENPTRTELLTYQKIEVYDGIVDVIDSNTQRVSTPVGCNAAQGSKKASRMLCSAAR